VEKSGPMRRILGATGRVIKAALQGARRLSSGCRAEGACVALVPDAKAVTLTKAVLKTAKAGSKAYTISGADAAR